MEATPSYTPDSPTPRRNRTLLIAGLVGLILVCICIAVVGAFGGGLYLSGRLGAVGLGSPTPIAKNLQPTLAISSPTPGQPEAPASSPTLPISPTIPDSPTAASPTIVAATTTAVTSATPSGPIASPVPPSANWPVALSDGFVSNTNVWTISKTQPDTADYGTINETIGNGKFELDANLVKAVNIKYWPANMPTLSDQSVTVDAQRISGQNTDFGLVFRKDSGNNCYVFLIRDDKKQFAVYLYQGQWTNLIDWTSSDAIQSGQVNRLNVTAEGSHLTFSINAQTVGSVDNALVPSGVAGVVFDMSANSQAKFDFTNFEVRAPAGSVLSTPIIQTTISTPTAPATNATILSDDFSSNSNLWTIADSQPDKSDFGTFNETIGGGKFRIDAQVTKGVNQKYYPKNLQPVADISLTVDAKRVSGPTDAAYGLVFRRDGNGGFYVFEIRDDKQFAVWLFQNQWTAITNWTSTDAIQPGQTNRINVTATGAHMTFSVNGTTVGTADNSQVGSGVVGLAIDMNPGEAVFEFSNFQLNTPTGGGQPTPSSAAPFHSVLSETFASNANGWNIEPQQPAKDDWGTYGETIGNGKFKIDANVVKGTNQKRWPKINPVSDFTLAVDAQRTSGATDAGYGLMFRRDTNGNLYLFEVRDDKQFSVWEYQGSWSALVDWTNTDAIRPGQLNHLQVTAIGSHFTFSINNQQVGSADNSQVPSGVVGIVFDMNPGQAVFEFSNFDLSGP